MNIDIIIDGYNLIHAWGWLPNHRHRQSLQQGRARMLQRLAEIVPAAYRPKITIVFDAGNWQISHQREEDSPVSPLDNLGFSVVFASQYDEADTMIEELILKSPHPQNLRIVSSDQRLTKAAQRRRGTAIRSQDCLDEFEKLFAADSLSVDHITASTKPQDLGVEKVIPADLKEIDWLAEFKIDSEEPLGVEKQPIPKPPKRKKR